MSLIVTEIYLVINKILKPVIRYHFKVSIIWFSYYWFFFGNLVYCFLFFICLLNLLNCTFVYFLCAFCLLSLTFFWNQFLIQTDLDILRHQNLRWSTIFNSYHSITIFTCPLFRIGSWIMIISPWQVINWQASSCGHRILVNFMKIRIFINSLLTLNNLIRDHPRKLRWWLRCSIWAH